MKKIISSLVLLTLLITLLAGCGSAKFEVKEIGAYFYEAGTYTSLDFDFVNRYFAENNDNWGGGCSAVSAVVDGVRLVGRNMDLNISDKCAYVVKTKLPQKYETIGLAYTFRDISPDYEELKANGLGETFSKVLPFMCDDVLNSEGLHIEINMRHGEQDADGNDLFGVEHTNENAALRVYVFALGQYLALNCKNLDAVKQYLAEEIDVYSKKDYWNYSYIITDAEGNSALLEFGHGTYYWTETDENGIVAQTNFYVNEECSQLEDIKTGLGRYETLMNEIGSVSSKRDLYDLMKKVQYSSYYLPYDECKRDHFDPRSEIIGEDTGTGLELTYDFVMDPDNEELISEALTSMGAYFHSLSREEQQKENYYWESTFTEVVNPKDKTIEVRLFENDSYLYRISFKGVEKISSIG